MPQSLSNILIHLVFSTKNRARLISAEIEKKLWAYMAGICKAAQCTPHRIGGTENHVHVVCGLARTVTVSKLVEELKKGSSKWMKTKGVVGFCWQNGYGAFSIGQSQFENAVAYIARQKEHHHRATFEEEYRKFLKKYGIDYDERYVWY